jgi:glycosyltransferase involved in cell wall biosynthesis
MNISIIVGGRFHAFNLAEQLNNNNNLKQLITTYPKYFIKKNYGIDKKKIQSLIFKEIVQRSFLNKIYNFNDKLIEDFDNKAQKLIDFKDLDILIGWSSFSLKSFQLGRNNKCLKILERGSTHIDFQTNIMKEEYLINNLRPNLPSKYIIDKEKMEYQLADHIMVPTEIARQTFLTRGFSEKKIIKIPYGVDLNEFQKKISNKKKGLIFRIIYTGTLSIRKGVLYLLKAFDELNLKNSQLLMIGNIDREINSKINKYRSNQKIIFKKSISQSKLSEQYSCSNVFITCSIEEGLSMVQLQAMSCGLPIICTPNSGGDEIIDNGNDGFILPIRDTEELKKKILYLYNNQSICFEMGMRAQKKIKDRFSWETYGKNVISTYQKLLKK